MSSGLIYGEHAYFKSGWNIMDGTLVIVSLFDTIISVIFGHTSKIFDILRVFRLVRALRPLRVINRAPGLKLVVQTLLSSLKPIGNIVLICCTFFIIFGILGVQVRLFLFIHLETLSTVWKFQNFSATRISCEIKLKTSKFSFGSFMFRSILAQCAFWMSGKILIFPHCAKQPKCSY